MEGLALLTEALGITLAAMLERTERIVHGTTVATNALLERRGARVGLLTTEGHIDILEMREGLKDDRYNLARRHRLSRWCRATGGSACRSGFAPDGRVEATLSNASVSAGDPGTEAPEESTPSPFVTCTATATRRMSA